MFSHTGQEVASLEMRCGCTSSPCIWISNDSDGKYRGYLFWNSMQDRKFPPWKYSVGTHLHPVFGCQTSTDRDGKWQTCAPSDHVLFVDSHPPTLVFPVLLYLHYAGSAIPCREPDPLTRLLSAHRADTFYSTSGRLLPWQPRHRQYRYAPP